MFRIFLAQQRTTPDVLLVTSLLQRWMVEPRPEPPLVEEVHAVLDHLVLATQLRFPVIGDLARSVRFRWFDQPLVDEARAEVLAGVGDELSALALDPDAPGHAQRVEALATIPEQIVRFLAERLERGVAETEPMLEVLVRRHYLEYELHDLRNATVHGRPFTTADYSLDDRPTHLVSTIGTVAELADTGSALVRDLTAEIDARPAGSRGGRGPLPVLAGLPGVRGRTRPAGCATWSPRCRSSIGYGGWPWRLLPATVARCRTSPSGPVRTAWSRTRTCAAYTRWWGAG